MKKKMTCFRRFGVKEPRHSETISEENHYFYRSRRPRLNMIAVIQASATACLSALLRGLARERTLYRPHGSYNRVRNIHCRLLSLPH